MNTLSNLVWQKNFLTSLVYRFSSSPSPKAVLHAYKKQVDQGFLQEDHKQVQAINQLDILRENLISSHHDWKKFQSSLKTSIKDFEVSSEQLRLEKEKEFKVKKQEEMQTHGPARPKGFFAFLSTQQPVWKSKYQVFQEERDERMIDVGEFKTLQIPKQRGIYFYGRPGCGKTFIMDMFYESIPFAEKQRIHYKEFMLKINTHLHSIRTKQYRNPLTVIGRERAQGLRLLCLDEFQVTDIGDAMILKNLFEALFNNNVVLVTTSNRPPDDLYKGGLQRESFVPFIPFLKQECHVIDIQSEVDYRLSEEKGVAETTMFYTPNNKHNNEEVDKKFQQLSGKRNYESREIEVFEVNRMMTIKQCGGGVAVFDFEDICEGNYGSPDYITICRHFHTVIIKNVKKLTKNERNTMKRFVTLIDEIYNHRTKLYMTCQVSLTDLFDVDNTAQTFPAKKLYDVDSREPEYDVDFALHRCKSRVIEMQTKDYNLEPSFVPHPHQKKPEGHK